MGYLIENLIQNSNLKDRITFVKNKIRTGYLSNTYKAIHYFCNNPNSAIVILDGDDAFLGQETLQEIYNKYSLGADVTLGKMYRTDKLYAYYPYNPNFTNPRLTGGNVWQHLRTFKKYLFDSINLYDFKYKDENPISQTVSKKWFEYCADFAYMVPITEMADNPVRIERYNYYHERTTPATKEIKKIKENIVAEILNKRRYTKNDVIKNNRKYFPTNFNMIEIDITYDCNLKCIACNRSCTQAPSNNYISLNQISEFIKESIEIGKKWEFINILGGEPTLHPEFKEIINLILNEYIYKFSKKTFLQITSNGYTKRTKEMLREFENIPNIKIDYNSFKTNNKLEYFTPFNIAPIDVDEIENKEFEKGCWVASYCGIGLNQFGYYPCGVAGGIDRVIGLNIGLKSLKDVNEEKMKELKKIFCRYCGNYIDYQANYGNFIPRCEKTPLKKNIITKIWKNFYKKYNQNKPKLSKIYE